MNKRLALSFFLAAALIFVTVPAYADGISEDPWTGDPDPYACNAFDDCYWTVTVCIEGVTYEVGIYYNPAGATPEQIAADAIAWSGIELTYGGCSAEMPQMPLVVPDLWAYVNPDYVAPEGVNSVSQYDVCFILSDNGQPSVERRVANCDYLWPSGPRPGWTEGAILLTHGPVYYDGTDWGWWTGDPVVSQFTYTGMVPRLPLYGSPGLFTVWCEYTQSWTEELPPWCLP